MKLNPLKCAFVVNVGKFLGFMVTQKGIEANPIQLKTIMDSQTLTSKKGVQQLIGSSREVYISLHRPVKTIFHHPKGSQRDRLE